MSSGTSEHETSKAARAPAPGGHGDDGHEASDPLAMFTALSSLNLGGQSLTQNLAEVARLARRAIGGTQDVAITVLDHARPVASAFTGPLAATLDERAHPQGFGPCVEAASTAAMLEIGDTARPTSHPAFCALARRGGVGAILSIGLGTRGHVSATMSVYLSVASGPLRRRTRHSTLSFAAGAAATVLNAALYDARRQEVEQLQFAMTSRAQIEQAKGIIMGQAHCSADEAFDILILRSSREHRKVRDIAVSIVQDAASWTW